LDVILDANALITACKFSIDNEVLVDILLRHCHLRIPQHVAEEATRRKEHPDARRAARRVANGSLHSDGIVAHSRALLTEVPENNA